MNTSRRANLKKQNHPSHGGKILIILSIDYGDTRSGLALCDKLELLASPLTVITERKQKLLIEKIAALAEEHRAETLLVGLPKNMNGSLGERAEICVDFAEKLKTATNLPVEMWDERLSTVGANSLLNETGNKGKKRKQIIDAVAATMILQNFLDYRKTNR